MVSEEMFELGTKKSSIRNMYEYGRQRAAIVGNENIYDFSLGNPIIPPPAFVKKSIIDILNEMPVTDIHGYTIAPGNPEVRETIAQSLNTRFNVNFSSKNLFMTSGCAAALTICFKALYEPEDEFIILAPYFPEYRCFIEAVGGKVVVVPARTEDFQIDFDALEKAITQKTKAVIINSPNNPSGVVYTEATIKKLASLLKQKEIEYIRTIFLISDEPYRELVYDGIEVPYLTKYYNDTLVCYSYSKSLSLPGERIGYIVVPNEISNFVKVYGAIAGAARIMTHVNAPSLFQLLVGRCVGLTSDISAYEKAGRLLYEAFLDAGFSCLKPQGAFYLFPKALEYDDVAFCERAKKYDLLFVPGRDFGCTGYFRAAYCCITSEKINNVRPILKKLATEYRKKS